MSKGMMGAGLVAALIILSLVGVAFCTERIPAGYVGIVYNMRGGVEDDVLTQGVHFVSPLKKITKYSTAIEQDELSAEQQRSFDIPTSDGKTINVDLEYSYHFDPEKVTVTFERFKGQNGKKIEETFIRGKVKAWAGEVSATYPVTDVFGDKRAELNTSTKEYIKSKFEEYGIVIDSVNFTRIETDQETAAAIQKKVNAQQELELAKIEAETAEVQANKEKEVALINAEKEKEVALIKAAQEKETATQKAEAAKIRGEGIAAENRAISQSLTKEILDMKKYEKWNGVLPQVSGGSNDLIVDVRG